MSKTGTISSHILDTTLGKPAVHVEITVYRKRTGNDTDNDEWQQLKQATTNSDGRCSQLVDPEDFKTGVYKLHFNVRTHFEAHGLRSFYPFIEVVCECHENEHYHVPLLLNPFSYSTYRGT